jgi:hypothetical protein
MSKNTQLTNLAVNAMADALAALANGGSVKIYDGAQPATGDTAISTQVLLATLGLSATAFAAAVAGVITANAITAGVAGNTGTAAWFRVFKSDGATAVFDGSVGTSAANLILPTTSITAGVSVTCSSFTHTVQKATAGL